MTQWAGKKNKKIKTLLPRLDNLSLISHTGKNELSPQVDLGPP